MKTVIGLHSLTLHVIFTQLRARDDDGIAMRRADTVRSGATEAR